jgi:hypothetical protein
MHITANMKTVFDKTTRDELISRINALNENDKAGWGRMNLYQALKHCTLYGTGLPGKKYTKYEKSSAAAF